MSPGPLRHIPSLSELLENPKVKILADRLRPGDVVATVRVVLEELRAEFHAATSEKTLPSVSELAERISRRVLEQRPPRPTRAINATGILLHPELGTPPWPDGAIRALDEAVSGYSSRGSGASAGANDVESNRVVQQLRALTRADDALVFCEAGAATIMVLEALGAQREIIVSRGQVIQRGSRYRLPGLAAAASVGLREIGAANHVGLDDYRDAIGGKTAAILVVHRHDAKTADHRNDIPVEDLARLAREHQLPLVHDLGPATIVDLESLGVQFAPRVSNSIAAGADLVIFSHELLGGPPCGIVVGRNSLIKHIEQHAAAHAAFLGQPLVGSFAATLDEMDSPDRARANVPLVQLLTASADNLKNRAARLAPQMAAADAIGRAEVVEAPGYLLGAPHPLGEMPGWAIALRPSGMAVEQLAKTLRDGNPAVFGYRLDDRLLLNLRAVSPQFDLELVERVEEFGT
ncbi:MAG: L-seryl-tRNA(Sec) selenium transferase [Pirellulaceae bacterium]|nr:L-seryl-tRNA(Sec) selenium transferase [Pirellulaceae bacterium]